MRVMNHLLSNLLDQGVVIFLDDILIYIKDATTYFELLKKVLNRLYLFQFYVS